MISRVVLVSVEPQNDPIFLSCVVSVIRNKRIQKYTNA